MTRLCRVLNEFKDDVNEGGGDEDNESDLEYIVLWNYNLLLTYLNKEKLTYISSRFWTLFLWRDINDSFISK